MSGVLLQEKAKSFFSKLYPDTDPESFKGSTGWLRRFNERHGIKNVQLRGEILSSDMTSNEPFQEELKKVIATEGYSRDQIFNGMKLVCGGNDSFMLIKCFWRSKNFEFQESKRSE